MQDRAVVKVKVMDRVVQAVDLELVVASASVVMVRNLKILKMILNTQKT
jgi:hypothetical protein